MVGTVVGAGALAGVATLGYSLWEARQFTLRRVDLPVLPPGHRPLKVLHLSDIHLTPKQRDKIEWIRWLEELEPDLVVNTGDNLSHQDAVPVLLDALGGLLDVPGVFVFGSNDYFAPRLRNPLRYLVDLGALTTNCDLEPARVKGLHRHPADSRPGDPGSSWLHVSAGVGTNPYTPMRVACRPEATLITLVPKAS